MNNPFAVLLEPAEKKTVHTSPTKLTDASGRYRLGRPARPAINHDNGFLDTFPKRAPTAGDRLQFAKWLAMLEGSEALCSGPTKNLVPSCSGEDLADANAAYRHFLFGKGKDRTINYERYLQDDASGREVIPNILRDFQQHAEIIGRDRVRFSVTSNAYSVGNTGIAPYPATANWQKAIGAHFLWVSADVSVAANAKAEIIYTAEITIHMEDRYNFNPGNVDIATGVPDSANGIFEVTGMAHQYTNYATVRRQVSWREGDWSRSTPRGAPTSRQRKPGDNRRVRNRT